MVAAGRSCPGHRRAAELAAPDDERVVEQAALLEIADQRRAATVGVDRARSFMPALMPP